MLLWKLNFMKTLIWNWNIKHIINVDINYMVRKYSSQIISLRLSMDYQSQKNWVKYWKWEFSDELLDSRGNGGDVVKQNYEMHT